MQPDFTLKLLKWNAEANRRDMPWKGETDPYRIWLSEVMLQQTRVEQGRAYYEKFIKTFPSVHDLAAAPDGQVFKIWEGLGYYSRCRNLLDTARYISSHLNGNFPRSYEEILKLKGIGPYTAAAIASFAFNENRAVVDGNVQRVIARYFGMSTPIDSPQGKKLFAGLAQSLIDERFPAIYNQAIMDFGATVCRPKNPLCNICVQAGDCEAFRHGFVNMLPVKGKSLKKRTRWFYYFLIEVGDSIYVRRREAKDIWQNLHEFVLLEKDEPDEDPGKEFLPGLLQQPFTIVFGSEQQSQQLTHQRINGRFFVVSISSEAKIPGNYELVKKSGLSGYAFPKFINSFLENDLENR
jgi:A/G-specific adenine glycosylase